MNDREFERIFRDRLYDQSYPPRPQLWKQLRLRWRNRIAARQWRWFYSASVVVVVVMMAARAGKPAAAFSTPATSGAATAAVTSVAPGAARGAGTSMAPGAGKAGALRRRDGAVAPGSGGVASISANVSIGGVVAADRHRVREGRHSTEARGLTQGATGGATKVMAGAVSAGTTGGATGGGTGGATAGARAPVTRNGDRMGVQLPRLAQLATRGGVQLPARAKAAHVSLPERPRKEAEPVWNGWSGEVYGSPDLPTAQFNFSWTAGFRVSRIFATHYSITTGLQYSTVNVQRGDWTATVLYPARFNNLDLPILLGYSTNGKRFRMSAYAGGYFNLISHPSGSPGWPWPNRSGPSAYLGLDMNYVIRDGWSLFAQPYGRCLFSNGSNSLFPSQIFTEGALIGVRYRLIR